MGILSRFAQMLALALPECQIKQRYFRVPLQAGYASN